MARRRYPDPYTDRRCADGILASGWRKVRKGGRVKFSGFWYSSEKLAELPVGELVQVSMGCYYMTHVDISRGAIGCTFHFCKAGIESNNA